MLYIIGIGLRYKDISLRALEVIKECDYVYLENYTSILSYKLEDLEKLIGKKVVLADRDLVESKNKEILDKAKEKNVAFLVMGDVFTATTHISFLMDAIKKNIKYEIVHGVSVFIAVGDTGLSLYNFGKTTSIPFQENVEGPYDVLKENKDLHTLVLLDIGMDIADGIKSLLDVENKRKENIFTEDKIIIGCSGMGLENNEIKIGKVKDIIKYKFKNGSQCIIVPGKLHFVEEEFLERFK